MKSIEIRKSFLNLFMCFPMQSWFFRVFWVPSSLYYGQRSRRLIKSLFVHVVELLLYREKERKELANLLIKCIQHSAGVIFTICSFFGSHGTVLGYFNVQFRVNIFYCKTRRACHVLPSGGKIHLIICAN
jgi:hypothetical protein